MANANLFQQYLQQPKSVLDYSNDYAKADALRNSNAMQSLTLQQAANVQQQRNALRDAVQSGQIDLNDPSGSSRALTLAPDVAPGLMDTIQKGKTAAAAAVKDTAQAGNFTADAGKTNFATQMAKRDKALTDIAALQTPQDAIASLNAHHANGDIDDTKYQAVLSTLAPALRDPSQFPQWQVGMLKGILTPKENLDMSKPDVQIERAGDRLVPIQKNAYAPGGVSSTVAGVSPIKIGESPDTAATQAGENSRAAAGRATQLQVAGIGADGSPASDVQTMAQMIADGRLPPLSGFALARPRGQQIMATVQQINPTYDATSYGAKQKAAKDFTSGTQGNALRSFAVAGQHLDQLGTLVDALDNGNVQIINKIGNQIGAQLGSTAPTNFDAAKDVVSKEVTKAIVGGGGGVSERAELAHLLSEAKTPAQLKGVITQYRGLMSAQHDALIQQRTAAGLSDSTLPGYSEGAPMAPGAFKITHIDGKPQ